jgi:hypothetical protein
MTRVDSLAGDSVKVQGKLYRIDIVASGADWHAFQHSTVTLRNTISHDMAPNYYQPVSVLVRRVLVRVCLKAEPGPGIVIVHGGLIRTSQYAFYPNS